MSIIVYVRPQKSIHINVTTICINHFSIFVPTSYLPFIKLCLQTKEDLLKFYTLIWTSRNYYPKHFRRWSNKIAQKNAALSTKWRKIVKITWLLWFLVRIEMRHWVTYTMLEFEIISHRTLKIKKYVLFERICIYKYICKWIFSKTTKLYFFILEACLYAPQNLR